MDQQDCPLLKKQLTCKGKDFIVLPITWLLMEASYLNNSLLCCTRAMCKIKEDWAVEYVVAHFTKEVKSLTRRQLGIQKWKSYTQMITVAGEAALKRIAISIFILILHLSLKTTYGQRVVSHKPTSFFLPSSSPRCRRANRK